MLNKFQMIVNFDTQVIENIHLDNEIRPQGLVDKL